MKLSQDFNLSEFTVTSTGLANNPGPREVENILQLVVNVLQPLRNYLKRPIRITSGYRSPEVNKKIGGAGSSQHLSGQAADFVIDGLTNQQIIDAIKHLRLPYDQLIDEQLKGKKWVHVSYSDLKNRGEFLTARDSASGGTDYKMIARTTFASPPEKKKIDVQDPEE